MEILGEQPWLAALYLMYQTELKKRKKIRIKTREKHKNQLLNNFSTKRKNITYVNHGP